MTRPETTPLTSTDQAWPNPSVLKFCDKCTPSVTYKPGSSCCIAASTWNVGQCAAPPSTKSAFSWALLQHCSMIADVPTLSAKNIYQKINYIHKWGKKTHWHLNNRGSHKSNTSLFKLPTQAENTQNPYHADLFRAFYCSSVYVAVQILESIQEICKALHPYLGICATHCAVD